MRGCAKRCAVIQGDFALHRRHVTLDVILMHNIYKMYSKIGQSNQSNQRVGTSNTKNIQRVGQMATHNKPMNNKSVLPNIQEQTEQYNKNAK